jgi:hypothetical protein
VGFWDFIAPDFGSFHSTLSPILPELIWVGPVPLQKDLVIAQAWTAPFSGAGLAMRVYWELNKDNKNRSGADAVQNGISQQVGASPTKTITLHGATIMGQLVIANVYRIAIRMVAGGKDVVNVVHVEGTASGQESAAATAALAAWKVAAGPLAKLSSLVAMQDVTAMDLSSTNGGIAVLTDATAGGISTTNSLATRAAAMIIKLNGGTRSRSTRGRIYYGPIMEQNINTDGATVAGSGISDATTAFTNFKNSLAGANFTLGVASRKLSSFTSAGTIAVETTVATQRRRLRS